MKRGYLTDTPVSEWAKLYLPTGIMADKIVAAIEGETAPAAPPCGQSQANWYALYTAPRHEKRVAEQVRQRRFSCLLPLYRSVRRWKDRRKELDLVLFPGYVFVQMALDNKLKVLQLPGVVRLVSFNGQPVALPAGEVEALQNRLSTIAKIAPHAYLHKGRRVRVQSGPMQGLEGIIVRRKNTCRVVFSIDLIMRSVAVEVDEADLEAA
jgi:transcription antitermination factor NusG